MIFPSFQKEKIFNCLVKYQEGFLGVWCHELTGFQLPLNSCRIELYWQCSGTCGQAGWEHVMCSLTACFQLLIAFGSLYHSCASNKSVPFHFLFSTENASLSMLFFSWISHNYHKSFSLGLHFTCYLFMPAMCKLWRCSYKSVARHLDSCREGNWFCLPTLALPAVLLNVHKTQPKPNKANIPRASTFFYFESSCT